MVKHVLVVLVLQYRLCNVFVQRLLGYSEKEGGEGGWQRPGGSDLLR